MFRRAIPARGYRLSDLECDAIKESMRVDEVPSEVLTMGGGCLWGQLWAHGALDSMSGAGDPQNRYTGQFDGSDGVYPRRGKAGAPVIGKDGKFSLPNDDLPTVNVSPTAQIVPDNHRGNENPGLKAHHLAFAKSHNKRMDEHGDFERAKTENLATWIRLFVNETMHMCQANEKEMFSVAVKDFNTAMEFNFAVARVQHATAAGTLNGHHIFEPRLASEVDLIALYDGSEMARNLDFGLSPAMARMTHVGGEIDIRERTISRHGELTLASYGDLARAMRVKPNGDINQDWPIWPALLLEAEIQGDGFMGPVGRRAFMDGIAGSIPANLRSENRWKGAPVETLDILDWAVN